MIKEKKISFFCVGAAKSGTSAMHDFLLQHPDVFMPALKEIHHFAPDILLPNDYWLNKKNYLSLFKTSQNYQVKGETSVFYLLSEIAAQNIFNDNPNARIIIIIRNPVDVAYSLHAQLVYNGEENIIDFKEALDAEENRLQGINLPRTRIQKKHIYSNVIKYYQQVKRFIDIFGIDKVKIILYDDFKTNPVKIMQEVYTFIGVDESFSPKFKIVNSNKKIKSRKVQKINKKITDRILSPIFGLNNARKFNKLIIKLNTKYVEREDVSEEIRNRLIAIVKSDIQNLEKLINLNLKNWYN